LWSFNRTGGVNNALKDIALVLAALPLAVAQSDEQSTSQRQTARMFGAIWCRALYLYSYTPGIPSSSFVSFWIPWRLFWGYFAVAVVLCVAMMIVVKRRERDAATILGAMILSVTVITYLVRMAAHVGNYGELTNTMKDVAVARSSFA
jgi:hypothetical protein